MPFISKSTTTVEGVPEGDRDRLFEPFFTSKRESGGTGLGLSIARSMLTASQGELWLRPSSTGACFELGHRFIMAHPDAG